MSSDFWDKRHEVLQTDLDWANRPSLFAEYVVVYFPKDSFVLDLGGGQGQDAVQFARNGHRVISTDFSEVALQIARSTLPDDIKTLVEFQNINFTQAFPFDDESFDVVYAHLSLHYFDDETTERIFSEIYRVLKPGGLVAILVNSTKDPEFKELVEHSGELVLQVQGTPKRFFDIPSMKHFTHLFETMVIDDMGTTNRDLSKGIFTMVRYIGRKPI